jgi:hypothetical protein
MYQIVDKFVRIFSGAIQVQRGYIYQGLFIRYLIIVPPSYFQFGIAAEIRIIKLSSLPLFLCEGCS